MNPVVAEVFVTVSSSVNPVVVEVFVTVSSSVNPVVAEVDTEPGQNLSREVHIIGSFRLIGSVLPFETLFSSVGWLVRRRSVS